MASLDDLSGCKGTATRAQRAQDAFEPCSGGGKPLNRDVGSAAA